MYIVHIIQIGSDARPSQTGSIQQPTVRMENMGNFITNLPYSMHTNMKM